MSYTNYQQVRHHLISTYPATSRVTDQQLALSGTDDHRFFSGPVEPSSLRVKSVRAGTLTRLPITFVNGTAVVAGVPIVADSVVVASDTSLGCVYERNQDYIIDPSEARITVKSGGVLNSEGEVVVWFVPYLLYEEGRDYTVDCSRGSIRRLGTGGIADGETVRLDYSPVYSSVADEIIENAVTLANSMVRRQVDPERQFEVDSTLGAAATYRALEIVCRASASRALGLESGGDRMAVAWMKLAEVHAERSESLLRDFRPPYQGPRTPTNS